MWRINWKPKNNDFNVQCLSKTCKTNCLRKQINKDIKWNLEYQCNNYWNGKNWDKPELKEENKNQLSEVYIKVEPFELKKGD